MTSLEHKNVPLDDIFQIFPVTRTFMNLAILSLALPVVVCSLVSQTHVSSHDETSQILDIGSFVAGSLYLFVNLRV